MSRHSCVLSQRWEAAAKRHALRVQELEAALTFLRTWWEHNEMEYREEGSDGFNLLRPRDYQVLEAVFDWERFGPMPAAPETYPEAETSERAIFAPNPEWPDQPDTSPPPETER